MKRRFTNQKFQAAVLTCVFCEIGISSMNKRSVNHFFLYFNLSWVLWTCSTLVGVVIFRLSGRWNFFLPATIKIPHGSLFSCKSTSTQAAIWSSAHCPAATEQHHTARVNTIGYGSLWVLLQKTSIFSISWYSVVVIFFQEAFIL